MVAEKFRDWKVPKQIKIVYTNPETKERFKVTLNGETVLEFVKKTVEHYAEMDLKLTTREIYYQLVAADISNSSKEEHTTWRERRRTMRAEKVKTAK